MATVIMALLYVLEGAILTVTAVVTGIKHSEFPDVRVGYHVRDAVESKEKWNDANVIAGLVSGVFAVIFFAAAILVYWNRIDTDRSIALFFILSAISIGSVLLIPAYLLKASARLRKKAKTVIRNILIVIFVIAAAWIGWLCAYYNTKNADNLPTLENLQTEDMDDLVAISRATKLPEAELQEYLSGSLPSDFSRIEYLNIFLILLLHEKPVSDTYYRDLMDGLTHVFEIPEDTIARYAGVSMDELNAFENSDKREHIERCIAHLFVTFMRDSRFTCEDGPWVIEGCGETEQKEENQ